MYKTLILKKQKEITPPFFKKYAIAFLLTAACLFIQFLMKPLFGPLQYFLLFPLVFIVVALGGIGPALVVIFMGGFGANLLLIDPIDHLNLPNQTFLSVLKFCIFAFSCLAGSWVIHSIQNKQQALLRDIEVLKESDKQFKVIADSSPVLIWMTNAEKVTSWVNKNWRDFIGYNLEDSIAISNEEIIYPDDFENVMKTFSDCVDARKDFKMEYRLKRFDGEYRWVLCNGVPMYNGGVFCGYVGVCLDINDHKVAEEKIKKAVQSRDQFLAVASHELKTPIASLTLLAQVFKRMIEKDEKEMSKEKVITISEQITRQVFRLDRLIDDMLDNSRINSGRFTIHPEEMDLCEVSRDVADRIKNQFSYKKDGGPIINHCAESNEVDGYIGVWDKIKIEQVLTNLLTNAIKYGNKEPIEIRLKPTKDSVIIEVKDHGIGISKDNAEKIFNRFYRVVGSNSEGGLGLGLFISKQIIKAHKGQIRVESQLGKGSTFIVELPKHTIEASEEYNA